MRTCAIVLIAGALLVFAICVDAELSPDLPTFTDITKQAGITS
jgi:hypothetical protein